MLSLIPLMGSWHLHYPVYNAHSLCDVLATLEADIVATTALAHDVDERTPPHWQDTEDIALPLAVVPWLLARGQRLQGILEPSPDPSASADFRRFAAQYPQLRQRLQSVDAQLRPLQTLLPQAMSLPRILKEVLPVLQAYAQAQDAELEEGPATDWLATRCQTMAQRLAEHTATHGHVTVLVPIDQLARLESALSAQGVAYHYPDMPASSPETRTRALLDVAFRGDSADPASLLAQLRQLAEDSSQRQAVQHEALFHQASILLQHTHIHEAHALLEELAKAPVDAPYFLPSYLLARLGQLRDLRDDRKGALRAYHTVLALDWAHPEAKTSAEQGLAQPFTLAGADT